MQQPEDKILYADDAGEKRFVTSKFCKQINSPRLSFAPEEFMVKLLDITPGSVSVMGLMNDKDKQVQLVIDRIFLGWSIWAAIPASILPASVCP